MRWIVAGFLLASAVSAQNIPLSVNSSGTGSEVDDLDTGLGVLTLAGTGTVSPLGAATVTATINTVLGALDQSSGSFTFSFPGIGSFKATFSNPSGSETCDGTVANIAAMIAGSDGTGSLSGADGTLNLVLTTVGSTGSGTFTLTGTGMLLAIALAPYPAPGSPNGPGPEGDPSLVNCPSCGQPVTLSNGNMYHQFTDLTLPSLGYPFVLTRTYNSQAIVGGVFGNGWTHSYRRWLATSGSSVTYYNESGGAYTFTAQGNGFTPPPGLYMTLSIASQGGYQLQTLAGDVMNFDAKGRLAAMTDPNGNTQAVGYNAQSNIATVSDATGSSLTFTYDANGHITALQDNTGRKVTYQYDGSGNLIASTDPTGAQTSYAYSGEFLATITFADGGTIDYTYDANNRVDQVVDRGGAKNQFTYTPGSQTVLQDELGNNTTVQLNATGNPTKKIKPDGTFTLQSFDSNLKLTSETDENGAVTQYQYDPRGNLLQRTNALGGVEQWTYDPAFNRVTSYKDAGGNVAQFQYDGKGNLVNVVDAMGNATTFTYDSHGNLLTSTDPTGATSSLAYDAHGNPTTVQDPLGNATQTAYDNLNRPVQVTYPLGAQYTMQYDADGRMTQFTNPLGQVFLQSYDGVGNLTRRTDPAGNFTIFGYDHLQNLTLVTDASGGITNYGYSPGPCSGCSTAGTLSSIQNAIGQNSSFTYNSNQDVTKATDAGGNVTQFSYDPAENITQVTDPNNVTTKFVYDALHRLTQRQLQDGSTESFTYDANGNLLSAKNPNVTLTYTYDALNRVTSALDSRFPAATMYTYDKLSRRASMTDPYGGQTIYTYDAAGHLVKLAGPNGTTTGFVYDAAGRRTAIAMGNGIAGAYQYDGESELTSVSYTGPSGALEHFNYTFDKAGNRISMTTSAGTHAYQYDALYRLTGATHPQDPPESYTYDAAGNRLSSALPSPSASGAIAFTYNASNRLASVTLAGGSTATYQYDAMGRRIEKNVAGIVTRYLYDGNNVLLEQDASGAAFRARYTYGAFVDQPLIMELSGSSYYYLADGAGNVVDLTDSTGAIVQSYDFDSFGRLLSPAGIIANPYVFAGRSLDPETGLYYVRARYYDPETGRFITPDPLSIAVLLLGGHAQPAAPPGILGAILSSPLELNGYAYAVNNPINQTDPFGLIEHPISEPFDDLTTPTEEERHTLVYHWDYTSVINVVNIAYLYYNGFDPMVVKLVDQVRQIGTWNMTNAHKIIELQNLFLANSTALAKLQLNFVNFNAYVCPKNLSLYGPPQLLSEP